MFVLIVFIFIVLQPQFSKKTITIKKPAIILPKIRGRSDKEVPLLYFMKEQKLLKKKVDSWKSISWTVQKVGLKVLSGK
jgi:hypothetical protein